MAPPEGSCQTTRDRAPALKAGESARLGRAAAWDN